MKKYFAIALLLCCTLASGQEKLFNAALKNGRERGKYYKVENLRDQVIDKDAFDRYARQHDFYIGECETKRISRFGSLTEIVSVYYFLPKNEYDAYLFEHYSTFSVPFSSLNKKGKGVLYSNYAGEPMFREYSDISWNGNIVDGRLDGKGIGYVRHGEEFVYFEAFFEKGFPVGRNSFCWCVSSSSHWNEMSITTGHLKNGAAYYNYDNVYGFVKADGIIFTPRYTNMISEFKGNVRPEDDYAVVVADDGFEWKLNIKGKRFDYSDKQKKIFAEQKAAEEEAARVAAEKARLAAEQAARERKIAEQKAAEERRIAMEKQRIYNQKVKENSDPQKWDVGDRLCLVLDANEKDYVTGTIEEWNSTKSKVKIKIVTSPGSRRTYNGEYLEKNNTMWVSASGEGWHKALPEELEAANSHDHSTHVNRSKITTMIKCPVCGGKGYTGNSYGSYRNDCDRCSGTGFINETQTITL